MKEVLVDDEKVEAVPEFCYLGDMRFLLAEVVNWLQSRTANRLRVSSANYSLSTPIAICHV